MKKKDRRTRWVTDLRELNKQILNDSYPLTNIQEILHSLQGATVFLPFDACGDYHTLQYICMRFGLANAGSVYSRMLDVAMKEVDRDFWTSYLDDILTYTGNLGLTLGI